MKIPKPAYTAEFKELAVKRIKDGQSVSKVCKEIGLSDQTLRNWVKAAAEGKLSGAGGKVVTLEEMELSRLRAENLRLKRELEIIKKRRRTSQGMFYEVRLDCRARKCVRPRRNVRRARRQHQRLGSVAASRIASACLTAGCWP
jgi:transposase